MIGWDWWSGRISNSVWTWAKDEISNWLTAKSRNSGLQTKFQLNIHLFTDSVLLSHVLPIPYYGLWSKIHFAFVAESWTYAQIFLAKWSPTEEKKVLTFFYFFSPFFFFPPFLFLPPFSFLLLFLSSFFLLTPSMVLYDCSYLTRNK